MAKSRIWKINKLKKYWLQTRTHPIEKSREFFKKSGRRMWCPPFFSKAKINTPAKVPPKNPKISTPKKFPKESTPVSHPHFPQTCIWPDPQFRHPDSNAGALGSGSSRIRVRVLRDPRSRETRRTSRAGMLTRASENVSRADRSREKKMNWRFLTRASICCDLFCIYPTNGFLSFSYVREASFAACRRVWFLTPCKQAGSGGGILFLLFLG